MGKEELEAIEKAISRQARNDYPIIYILDTQSGRVFEFGKNFHDRLIISEDGRSLNYYNLQNGDGSSCGDYRFYYEKPEITTEEDKRNEWNIGFYARQCEHKSLDEQDHQIELLNKRWGKLKEWLDKDITNGEWYFKVRNKMQELEQEKL